MDKLEKILPDIMNTEFINAVISNKRNKSFLTDKVKLRHVLIKGANFVQVTEYVQNKVFHQNLKFPEAVDYILKAVQCEFKQCQITTKSKEYNILVSKKGQVTIKSRLVQKASVSQSFSHNKEKNYLLSEGKPVDFLIELGVMNQDGYVIKSKYDKFRQINRFLEFIEDIVPKLPSKREVKIIDFGCGKSYLTFAIYYYLHTIKGIDVTITGLDLKEDVIKRCNLLAQKLGYHKLEFLNGDIADYTGTDSVDMVVTLHACDTATDYAIAKAVAWNARVIMSVPCCQHELNKQIENELFNPVLRYGILKERMAALITDGIRAELLRENGYDTQILEFIDMEHTPKNLLIRAVRKNLSLRTGNGKSNNDAEKLEKLIKELRLYPTLQKLLEEN